MKQVSTTTIFIALAVVGILAVLLLASGNNNSLYERLSLPLQVKEYFDYACSHCQDIHPTMAEIEKKFGSDVVVEYVYFNIFPQSLQLGYAAEAAREQGKYKEYHEAIFAEIAKQSASGQIDYANFPIERIAGELKLDLAKFNSDRESETVKQRIERNKTEGLGAITRGTPAVYVNEIPVTLETVNGKDYAPLLAKIEDLINRVKQK